MSRFDECLTFVLKREGGFSNHPADKGGATNRGITQKVYDDYRETNQRSVRYIGEREVRDIYQANYWMPAKCGVLPVPVDLVVFDSAVHLGVSRSARLLQQAVGVVADGNIGPITIDAVKEMKPVELAEDMIDLRRAFYNRIVDNNPSQKVFLKGWGNRLDALEKAIGLESK